jgi:hypothetical protein
VPRTARTITAVAIATAALGLTGCGSHTQAKPDTATTTAKPKTAPTTTLSTTSYQLGSAVQTDGDQSTGGVLELTPTSVIYVTKTFDAKPANGEFVTVTIKARAMTAVAASETVPAGNGGWTYVAPDGQAISTLDGNVDDVTIDGFNSGATVDPGTYHWDAETFDIAPSQVGGTLSYKDGSDHITRWKLPATTTGPQATKVEAALK